MPGSGQEAASSTVHQQPHLQNLRRRRRGMAGMANVQLPLSSNFSTAPCPIGVTAVPVRRSNTTTFPIQNQAQNNVVLPPMVLGGSESVLCAVMPHGQQLLCYGPAMRIPNLQFLPPPQNPPPAKMQNDAWGTAPSDWRPGSASTEMLTTRAWSSASFTSNFGVSHLHHTHEGYPPEEVCKAAAPSHDSDRVCASHTLNALLRPPTELQDDDEPHPCHQSSCSNAFAFPQTGEEDIVTSTLDSTDFRLGSDPSTLNEMRIAELAKRLAELDEEERMLDAMDLARRTGNVGSCVVAVGPAASERNTTQAESSPHGPPKRDLEASRSKATLTSEFGPSQEGLLDRVAALTALEKFADCFCVCLTQQETEDARQTVVTDHLLDLKRQLSSILDTELGRSKQDNQAGKPSKTKPPPWNPVLMERAGLPLDMVQALGKAHKSIFEDAAGAAETLMANAVSTALLLNDALITLERKSAEIIGGCAPSIDSQAQLEYSEGSAGLAGNDSAAMDRDASGRTCSTASRGVITRTLQDQSDASLPVDAHWNAGRGGMGEVNGSSVVTVRAAPVGICETRSPPSAQVLKKTMPDSTGTDSAPAHAPVKRQRDEATNGFSEDPGPALPTAKRHKSKSPEHS